MALEPIGNNKDGSVLFRNTETGETTSGPREAIEPESVPQNVNIGKTNTGVTADSGQFKLQRVPQINLDAPTISVAEPEIPVGIPEFKDYFYSKVMKDKDLLGKTNIYFTKLGEAEEARVKGNKELEISLRTEAESTGIGKLIVKEEPVYNTYKKGLTQAHDDWKKNKGKVSINTLEGMAANKDTDIANLNKQMQFAYGRFDNMQKEMENISNMKVEPYRLFNNWQGVVGTILLGIAGAAQQVAANISGRSPGVTALEVLDKTIDRDIALQVQEISMKKSNLSDSAAILKDRISSLGSIRAGIVEQKTMMLQTVESHLRNLNLQSQNINMNNQLKIAEEGVKEKRLGNVFEAGKLALESRKLDIEERKSAKGQPLSAVEGEKYANMLSMTSQAQKLAGLFKGSVLGVSKLAISDERSAYDAAKSTFATFLAQAVSGQAISENEMKRLMALVPEWGDRQDKGQLKIRALLNEINSKMKSQKEVWTRLGYGVQNLPGTTYMPNTFQQK